MTDIEALLKEADMIASLPGGIIPQLAAAVRELQSKLQQFEARTESAFVGAMAFNNKCTNELIIEPLKARAEKAEAEVNRLRAALEAKGVRLCSCGDTADILTKDFKRWARG